MNISLSHIPSSSELAVLNSILNTQLYSISYQNMSYLLKDEFGLNISFPSMIVLNCINSNNSQNSISICMMESIKYKDFSIYNLHPKKASTNNNLSELIRFHIRIDLIEIFQGEDEFYSLNNELLKLFLTTEFCVSNENKFYIKNISGIVLSELNGDSLLIKVDDYSIKLSSELIEVNKFKNQNKLYQNLKTLP